MIKKDYSVLLMLVILFIWSSLMLVSFKGFNSQNFSDIIIPVATILTGLVIFLTFRENQKGNKVILSKHLYDYLEKMIDRHVEENRLLFPEKSPRWRQEELNEIQNNDQHPLHKLVGTNPINYYRELTSVIVKLNDNAEYQKFINDYSDGLVSSNNMNEYQYSNTFQFVDYSSKRVYEYYKFLQDTLEELIFKLDKSLMPYDKRNIIERIIQKTGYVEFMDDLKKYSFNKDGEMGPSGWVKDHTIMVPGLDFVDQNLGFQIRSDTKEQRPLIDWMRFLELYNKHDRLNERYIRIKEKLDIQNLGKY